MIEYTLLRTPGGGRRYTDGDRAMARASVTAGDPATLTPAAVDAMTDPDGIRAVVDVLFELESNRLARPVTTRLLVDGAPVAPSAGDLATLTSGRRNTTAPVLFPTGVNADTNDVAVELTWSDPRVVNTIEVHGDNVAAPITAVRVDYRDAGGVWHNAGTGTGVHRITVPIVEVETYGIRAHILAGGGPTTRVVEVDPMLIRDLSDRVDVELTWSRETDPAASPNPVGSYAASTVTLTVDDTSGEWNPATNVALDVGHRIEVAVGVSYLDDAGLRVEEVVPAGVFYSDPFDTDSTSDTVTITGSDRLGRNTDVPVDEEVLIGWTVNQLVGYLAEKYLDLGGDQVVVSDTVGEIVIPYWYPTGNAGQCFADLAKATLGTLYIDALDRLVLARRTDTTDETVAELRTDNALIGYRRPPGYDLTTSVVTVTAAPLDIGAVEDLWTMPDDGVPLNPGQSKTVIADYSTIPALNAYTARGETDPPGNAFVVDKVVAYADKAFVTIRNNGSAAIVAKALIVRGTPLVERPLTVRVEHAPSIARYGPRNLEVAAGLVQTQDQLDVIADVLLDQFRAIDDNGNRRLPELELDALGLIHVEAGDRVTVADPAGGVAGDYTILSRTLAYSGGSLLLNGVRCREATAPPFLVADEDISDDVFVAGY